jgi:hypothetical protein
LSQLRHQPPQPRPAAPLPGYPRWVAAGLLVAVAACGGEVWEPTGQDGEASDPALHPEGVASSGSGTSLAGAGGQAAVNPSTSLGPDPSGADSSSYSPALLGGSGGLAGRGGAASAQTDADPVGAGASGGAFVLAPVPTGGAVSAKPPPGGEAAGAGAGAGPETTGGTAEYDPMTDPSGAGGAAYEEPENGTNPGGAGGVPPVVGGAAGALAGGAADALPDSAAGALPLADGDPAAYEE